MGLFDLFFAKDPSSDWPQPSNQPLLVSLVDGSINGLKIGAPANTLCKFGRPANKSPFKENRFLFDQIGVLVETENERISYLGLPVERVDTDDVGPCEFTIKFRDGKKLLVNSGTSAAAMLDNLPAITESDIDAEETVHLIELDTLSLELEMAPAGKMRRVNLYSR